MPLGTDQIMMLAQLADWAGSKMAPDNPFAGYAQQYVAARNFAKLLQPQQQQQKQQPGKVEKSALDIPFSIGGGGSYDLGVDPKLLKSIFSPGVKATVGEDNQIKLERTVPPSQSATGQQNISNIANPFLWAG